MKLLMKYMKTLKYTSALLLLIGFSSCEKVLHVDPRSSISDQQTITDKGSSETAIRAVYDAARGYYGTSFQSIAYLSGDNVQWTGSQSQVQEFINHKVNPENSTISGVWNGIYSTINRANHVISKVPALTDQLLTTALKDQITGEAYFIRALAYFDLARTWGGAPIITKPTLAATDNRGIAKSTQLEVFGQALADLETAETLLPLTTDRFRATRKTVWALKSRYYLYQKNWVKAEEFADKIISDATNYELLAPYNSFFFPENKRGTRESIFEFYYSSNETNGHRGQWQPQANGGTRQWAPNDAFVALVNNPEIGGTRSALVAKDNQNRWFGNLYYRSPGTDPTYVIRIAELYLIRAEARAQQGGSKLAGAVTDLNAVRTRSALQSTPAQSQADILLAIENERRFEFAFEAHRWFDLVRTGRAAAVLNVTDPNRLLMPIPIDQIQADKVLIQNPGY
jgi:hypothetical protein